MNPLQRLIAFFGRVCLSLIFLLSAIYQIATWPASTQGLIDMLCEWTRMTLGITWAQDILAFLVTWASPLLMVGVAFEILGGILLFFGYKVRFAALLLLLFLVVVTPLFHYFWWVTGAAQDLQVTMFLKNVSILGGLLLVLAFGKGRRPSDEEPFGT